VPDGVRVVAEGVVERHVRATEVRHRRVELLATEGRERDEDRAAVLGVRLPRERTLALEAADPGGDGRRRHAEPACKLAGRQWADGADDALECEPRRRHRVPELGPQQVAGQLLDGVRLEKDPFAERAGLGHRATDDTLGCVIVNRDPNARGPATAFAEVAGAYERGRPGYPEEAVRWLAGEEQKDVVDLGAGTGKLTRALVALGHRVTAIEPLPEMLELLPAAAPGAFAILGNAEVIPLPDAHADIVTCAQSFHWFDHAVALPEIARVLRPHGRLAFVWNSRDDREPWVTRLSKLIGSESVGRDAGEGPVVESGLFEPIETATFEFEQALDRERLLDLVLSRSYCAKLPPAEREPILKAVGELYDEVVDEDGVRLPYVTECFRAAKA
jgi:SAM-dependent methyltransferase